MKSKSRLNLKLNYKRVVIFLTFLWIAFIFARSLKPANQSQMESMWILELFYRLSPFRPSHYFIRKLAHFTEYAILGSFSVPLLKIYFPKRPGLTALLLSAPLGVLTALFDETIQLFVDGRNGEIRDIWLDILGCVTGSLICVIFSAVLRKLKNIKNIKK